MQKLIENPVDEDRFISLRENRENVWPKTNGEFKD